jgi:MoaA/NifB/PqqE/SkfB family radical SAM enzyme
MKKLIPDFPRMVSLTITNNCNLRCQMCAQWSTEGYIRNAEHRTSRSGRMASFDALLKTVDEIAYFGSIMLIRGGEALLYPGLLDLIAYAKDRGIVLLLESNGVLLRNFAEALVKLRLDWLGISVDGPREIHDLVRGVKGTFESMREGLEELTRQEERYGHAVHRSITCTLSADNYLKLGEMPAVARSLGFKNITIVPYYYFPDSVGLAYEDLMREKFACEAYSWRGFHHEASGVDPDLFLEQLHAFKARLGDLTSDPYMELTDEEYRTWYASSDKTVKRSDCSNIWGLLDVQPDGNVNFCVDFPDYVIGNIEQNSLYDLWHSERAKKFREPRVGAEMPVCYRCGAKYMGGVWMDELRSISEE